MTKQKQSYETQEREGLQQGDPKEQQERDSPSQQGSGMLREEPPASPSQGDQNSAAPNLGQPCSHDWCLLGSDTSQHGRDREEEGRQLVLFLCISKNLCSLSVL